MSLLSPYAAPAEPQQVVDASFPEALQVLFEPKRFKVLKGGRAGAKSWSVARALVLLGAQKPLRILCGREFQNSIKESVHQLLEGSIKNLGLESFYEIQRDVIRGKAGTPAAGTEFFFIGFHLNHSKIKSYEDVDICWVEEAQDLAKGSLEYLIPTIRKPYGGPFGKGSEIWFTYNPTLESDAVHQRFVVKPSEVEKSVTVCVTVNWRDNPWFPPLLRANMEHDRETDYDNYLHIWEGHTRQSLDGTVFADELRDAAKQERIRDVAIDASVSVDCIFDLGRSDHTSIWFKQQIAWEHHFVDFYQNKLKHIDHYLGVIQAKGYLIGTIWLPHDADHQLLGQKSSIKQQVEAKLPSVSVRIVPKMSIPNKINAGRTIFPTSWFDQSKCADGLHSLRHYKYEVKTDANGFKVFSQNPLHDWASDAADAFCYAGIVSKLGKSKVKLRLGEALRQGAAMLSPDEWFPGSSSDRAGTGWMGR